MGIRERINSITGVNRNRGLSRINANRLRRQMQSRLSATAR